MEEPIQKAFLCLRDTLPMGNAQSGAEKHISAEFCHLSACRFAQRPESF